MQDEKEVEALMDYYRRIECKEAYRSAAVTSVTTRRYGKVG